MKIRSFIDSIELSLTNHCALQCSGCSSLNSDSSKKKELDFSKVIPIIKDYELQDIFICGNGGEPLEHTNIEEILTSLMQSFPHANIRLATNGEKLSEKLGLDFFKNSTQQLLFEVALDGPSQEIHQITRKQGCFDRVLESIAYLVENQAKMTVVCTRHSKNEDVLESAYRLIKDRFGLELQFRDTSILTETLRPPTKISRNGDVSVLYGQDGKKARQFDPNFRNIYIECNGDTYPCVSFTKYKTQHAPVNIYNFSSSIDFLKAFLPFQKCFCNDFQKEGDLRQCNVNCGIYLKNFRFDTWEEIKVLNDPI